MSPGFFLKYPGWHSQYGIPLVSVQTEYCKSHVFWAKHRLPAKQKEVLQNKEINSATKSFPKYYCWGQMKQPPQDCVIRVYYVIGIIISLKWWSRVEDKNRSNGFEIRVWCWMVPWYESWCWSLMVQCEYVRLQFLRDIWMLLLTSALVTLEESENMLTTEICTPSPSLHGANVFTYTWEQRKITPWIQVRNKIMNLYMIGIWITETLQLVWPKSLFITVSHTL